MPRGIYITAKEAAIIISKNVGRSVSDQYVRDYARKGKIKYRAIDGRTNEYLKSDVEKVRPKKNNPRKPKAEEPPDASPPIEEAA